MKLLCAGGRNLSLNRNGWAYLDELHAKYKFTELINGMATGIDKSAREWAASHNIPIKEFPAQWNDIDKKGAVIKINKYGRKYNARAGHDRNEEMLAYTTYDDLIVVFPGGPGSKYMLKIALEVDANVLNLMDRKELVYESKPY